MPWRKKMGMFDAIVASAVPKGSLAKPLILALGALLASGALFKGNAPDTSARGKQAAPSDEGDGGLLGGLGGLVNKFQQNSLGGENNSGIGPGQKKQVAPDRRRPAARSRVLQRLWESTRTSPQ